MSCQPCSPEQYFEKMISIHNQIGGVMGFSSCKLGGIISHFICVGPLIDVKKLKRSLKRRNKGVPHLSRRFDLIIPLFNKKYAKYGIEAEYANGVLTRRFIQLPEISVSQKIKRIGKLRDEYTADDLVDKLLSTHYTPYVEEVLILRALEVLPQPIREAIADCIWGVMARRYIMFHPWDPRIAWRSEAAWRREAEFTFHEMYDQMCRKLMPLEESWEASARKAKRKSYKIMAPQKESAYL